jgi:hypothetical protein
MKKQLLSVLRESDRKLTRMSRADGQDRAVIASMLEEILAHISRVTIA